MNRKFKNNTCLFISLFLISVPALAAKNTEKMVCIPKKELIETLPLDFQSDTPTPPIPSTIALGDLASYVFTLENNSPDTMAITASITGSPSGDAVLDLGSQCLSGTWAPSSTCTLTVNIDPTVLGAAAFELAANYTVSGDPSCFDDATVDINYNAVDMFAYISNSQDNTVTVCNSTPTGSFTDCVDSGVAATFDRPSGIAIPEVTFSGNKYAYVANSNGNTVSQCLINLVDGTFTDPCPDSGAGSIFSTPADMTFSSAGGSLYAYISNNTDNDVTKCTTNLTNGTLGTCGTASAPFSTPFGIATQAVAGLSLDAAYITNQSAGTVTQCGVTGADGQLVHCFDAGPGDVFSTPTNIAFFETADIYAYITDADHSGTGSVWQCLFSTSTGLLSGCATTGSGFDHPVGISFETVASADYAYVTNFEANTIETCAVDSGTGNLTSCASSSLLSTDVLINITQQTFSSVNYLYVADAVQESILQCKIDTTVTATGNIYCIDSGTAGLFSAPPSSVVFQEVAGTTYGYVNEPDAGMVWQCTVNTTTGQFTGCVDSGPIGFENPYITVLGTVNSVLYAYISDVDFDLVWQCVVDPVTGALCDCVDAAKNLLTPLSNPIGVSFQTFAGTDYLYVGQLSPGAVLQCTLDSSTGLFTSCIDSGAGTLDQPTAFTFEQVDTNLFVYIPTNDNAALPPIITQCLVNTTTGLFSACTPNNFANAQAGIAFDSAGSSDYAYVTTGDTATFGEILRCTVGSDGGLSSCISPFGEPDSIALILLTGGSTLAYVAEAGGSGILACEVNDGTGLLSACVDAGTGFSFPYPEAIVIEAIGATTFAYITDQVLNSVTQCTPDLVTGILDSCVDSGAGAIFTEPGAITFDLVETTLYAYVVNVADDTVTQCTVDEITGLFSSCRNTGTSFAFPLGISFNGSKAYVASGDLNEIVTCDQNSGGFLVNCVASGSDPSTFDTPSGVAHFTDDGGDDHLYVTNSEDVGASPANTVAYCLIDPITGLLSGCTDSGLGQIFQSPAGIVFQSFGGTPFAYIANAATASLPGNSVSRCTLNADGTLNACVDSGAGAIFTNPISVEFLNR